MSPWQPIADESFVGGELELEVGQHGQQFRGKIAEINISPIANQLYVGFEWMAGLDLPNGRFWTKFQTNLPTDVCLMFFRGLDAHSEGRLGCHAIAIETEMTKILPSEPFYCMFYPEGGSQISNWGNEADYNPYLPQKQTWH